MDTILLGVIIIGLLHGLEPGHGWPIAFLYSIRQEKPYRQAFITSIILAVCHFVSSITAALFFVIASQFFDASTIWLKIMAIVLLLILAVRFWREKTEDLLNTEEQHEHLHGNKEPIQHSHEHTHLDGETHMHLHDHVKGFAITLTGLAGYGFLLGFAHEEEFALLALAMGGINPWALMTIYGICVSVSLVGITLLSVKIYSFLAPWIKQRMKYIPKISAITLLILAIILAIDFFV